MFSPKVVSTKITPPVKNARTFARPRIAQALAEALQSRLTILQAGAGFGKSTALTLLVDAYQPLIWYQVNEEDSDPLVFLLHLCHATRRALPELAGLPIHFLETWEGSHEPLPSKRVVDAYVNALSEGLDRQALLILDDIHLAFSNEVALLLDRLVGLAPPLLHVVLAGRPPVELPNLSRWRSQGEVASIDQSVLAFDVKEIATLFTDYYGYDLALEEAETLYSATEGWAVALQLIWQSLRSGRAVSVADALTHQAASLDSLFDILASEVVASQPEDVQEFMLVSATLREMTPEACDALRSPDRAGSRAQREVERDPGVQVSSEAMLAYLRRQELFVIDQGGGLESYPGQRSSGAGHPPIRLRYHNIFHNFLRQQAPAGQRTLWHSRAAGYFQSVQDPDEAIYHQLRAGETEAAAAFLDKYGAQLLAMGRLDTLSSYLDALPAEVLGGHPALLSYLGDLARLHSRFQESLGWYRQAEAVWREAGLLEGAARALRGQARVYLDTVNPSRAEELLQESLRLSEGTEDRQSKARLYELLSENKLNAGQAEEAERLRRQAEAFRSEGPSDSQLLFRVLLRTGRLDEARQKLEAQAEQERLQPVGTPRAHRETLLLLSLIYSFQGEVEKAYQTAQEGTRRGIDLNSPFVAAVGHMRQGHALTLPPPFDVRTFNRTSNTKTLGRTAQDGAFIQARAQFEKAIEFSQEMAVSRLLVEAYWGLCRAYGFQGDLVQALRAAQEGIEIASQAGDEWIACLIRLAMGASLALAGRYEAAEEWLLRAAAGFQECSDPFARCAARLWLCLGWFRHHEPGRLEPVLREVLSTCRSEGYDYLFTRPTLLGVPDERLLAPLLILARDRDWEAPYPSRLLEVMGLPEISSHPGYQLRVQTLGLFQVWRGSQPVPSNGWRREKARSLFQILVTHRGAPLDREQITEFLWPELDPPVAQRNFKVTLNTLYHILEPEREAGSDSAYVLREGTTYGLRPGADLWLDAQVFTGLIDQADDSMLPASPPPPSDPGITKYEQAVSLYQGEYLPEARYETWAAVEREHLAVLFLRTADRLSGLFIQGGRFAEAVELCQRILAIDNCWERAYQNLMLAYDRLGDHGQVARAYQRCVKALREELDIGPAPETEDLYQALKV